MFLRDKNSGDLIRIDDLDGLCNPWQRVVCGRDQAGEEEQDDAVIEKAQLAFPSGEDLPRCWVDASWRSAAGECSP